MISIIAAMAKNGVIGKGGTLPWNLPADMKRFKKLTSGHSVIMGRKTFESIGKPLPHRTNIIISRLAGYFASGCVVVPSFREAVSRARLAAGADEIFIIGGGEIYTQAIESGLVDKIYLTVIENDFDGDAYFPKIDEKKWKLIRVEEGMLDLENPHPHNFFIYSRASL